MRALFHFALVLNLLFAFSGSVYAAPNPSAFSVEFVGMKDSYYSDDKIKLTVEVHTSGDVTDAQFKVVPIGGNKDEEVTETATTYNQKKYIYTTIGYFTPNSVGMYIVTFNAKHDSFLGTQKIELSTTFEVKNPNELALSVSPQNSTIDVGQLTPILITYSSKNRFTFDFSEPVTELALRKVNGEYKKLVLFKATKAKKYDITMTATNNKTKEKKFQTISINAK